AGAGLGLALLDLVARGAALVPGGHVVMVAGWRAALVWATVAVAAWWLWNSPRRPWLIAARVAFVTTVLVATTFRDVVSLDACRCLTVHFLDVGQGDAAMLRTPNGRWIVIDAGPRTPDSDAGRRIVVPLLRRQGGGRDARRRRSPGRDARGGGSVRSRAGARAGGAAGAAAVSRVSRQGRRVGRALARGAGRRPDRAGRRGARSVEPGLALDDAAARCKRARRGANGNVWGGAPAVSGRCRTAGRGPVGGDGRAGGAVEGGSPRLAQCDLRRVARRAGAARGDRKRGPAQPLRPPDARRARAPRGARRHGAQNRRARHHHLLHGRPRCKAQKSSRLSASSWSRSGCTPRRPGSCRTCCTTCVSRPRSSRDTCGAPA